MHKTATIFFFSTQRQKPLILFLYCDFCVGSEVCYKYKGRFLYGLLSRPGFLFPRKSFPALRLNFPLSTSACVVRHTLTHPWDLNLKTLQKETIWSSTVILLYRSRILDLSSSDWHRTELKVWLFGLLSDVICCCYFLVLNQTGFL